MADPHGAEASWHEPATPFQEERDRKKKESTMRNSELMLDVSQINELELAFHRSGYTNGEIKKLCEGNILADVRSILRGFAEIRVFENVIDCDADPFVPPGAEIVAHRKGGLVIWDPKNVILHWTKSQKEKLSCIAYEIRDQLFMNDKPIVNACVLDRLLEFPELVPVQFNGTEPAFWGTVYRDLQSSEQFVQCFTGGARARLYLHEPTGEPAVFHIKQ